MSQDGKPYISLGWCPAFNEDFGWVEACLVTVPACGYVARRFFVVTRARLWALLHGFGWPPVRDER